MAASRVDQEASVDMLALELSRSRLLAPNKTVFNNGIRLAPKGHSGNVWGIWHAAAHGNHLRVRELIEDKGVGVDARDRDGGRTCLHWACKNADVKLIKYLLGMGADVNAPDGEGSTPLHYCAGWGIPVVCLYLLEQGADNRIRNMRDDTAEDVARRLSRPDNADLVARWTMSLPHRPLDPHPAPPVDPPVPNPKAELITQLQGLKVKTDSLGPWHPVLLPSLYKLADIYMDESHPNHSYPAAADVLKQAVAICDVALDDATSKAAAEAELGWEAGDGKGTSVSFRHGGFGVEGSVASASASGDASLASGFAVDGRRAADDWDGACPPVSTDESKGDDVGGRPTLEHPSTASAPGALERTVWTQTPAYMADVVLEDKDVRARRVKLGDALTRLGQVYSRQGQHYYVEPLLVRAVELLEDGLGPRHMEVARSLSNLALSYHQRGMYEDARPLLERCLEIQREHMGEEHKLVARTESFLGQGFLQTNQLYDAQDCFLEALRVTEIAEGVDSMFVAHCCDNLARVELQLVDDSMRDLLKDGTSPLPPRAANLPKVRVLPAPPPVRVLRPRSDSMSTMSSFGSLATDSVAADVARAASLSIRGHVRTDEQQALASLPVRLRVERLLTKSLTVRQALLPHDHPDVLASRTNLAAASCAMSELNAPRRVKTMSMKEARQSIRDSQRRLRKQRQHEEKQGVGSGGSEVGAATEGGPLSETVDDDASTRSGHASSHSNRGRRRVLGKGRGKSVGTASSRGRLKPRPGGKRVVDSPLAQALPRSAGVAGTGQRRAKRGTGSAASSGRVNATRRRQRK